MNRFLLATLLLLAVPAFAQGWDPGYGDQDGYASDSGYGPTFEDFRNDAELSWNGEWIDTPEYGTVWQPQHVSDDWQPYLYGRWVWTDAGWAWASDEPFGWAVYHYGQWAFSPAVGWLWIPGSVWAPAWVSWRWTDGYAAWCPLGPHRTAYQAGLWVVVPSRRFLEPVRHNVVPLRQRPGWPLPARTEPRAGPPVAAVERAVGRAVRPLPIHDGPTPGSTRAGSGGVTVYRPRTAPVAAPPRARQGQATPPQPQGGPRVTPRPTWYGAGPPPAQQRPQVSPAPRAVTPRASTGEQPQVKAR